MSYFFICNLFLFLLVYADSAYSQVHYYIAPSQNVHCPGDPCLTIAQFAANSTSYIGNETNISLSFLPGNHNLDRKLSLSHADSFSMIKDKGGNGTAFVECSSQSGRFNISETTFATIKGLHFIGCGCNRVSQVEQFIIEDTILQGVEGRGTVLMLNEVNDAIVNRSSFLSNIHSGTIFLDINFSFTSSSRRDTLNIILGHALDPVSSLAAGGALYIVFSNVSIVNSNFTDNTAEIGGALFAHNSSLHIVGSTCSYNRAGAITMPPDFFSVNTDNYSNIDGPGAGNNFQRGGVMFISDSSFSITNSTFTDNTAAQNGGVMVTLDSSCTITNSTFTSNRVGSFGGVVCSSGSTYDITSSAFTDNSAAFGGGAMEISDSSFNIVNSFFTDNSATLGGFGGAFDIYDSSVNTTSCTFTNNSAAGGGGVIITSGSSFKFVSSIFYANKANGYGGVMIAIECSILVIDGMFNRNSGSIYIFDSNLTFSGYTRFENCTEPRNKTNAGSSFTLSRLEGGAITSFQSTVTFTGVNSLSNNQARRGGAILSIESRMVMYGKTIIANNTATDSSGGGGISLQQSDLEIKGNCTISSNHAMRGGGIHATSSTIAVHQPQTIKFINNKAEIFGGGIYLEVNPKLYILKSQPSYNDEYLLVFQDNHASFGGAIYVADDTNSGACSPDNECFIQTLALYIAFPTRTMDILFSGNTASEQGTNLFGGLLDRCIASPFAEVFLSDLTRTQFNGVSYLGNISNIAAVDTISSLPVRVCFCKSESEPDCSYQPPTVKVKKGKPFTVPLVAVDQVNRSVEANIISSLSSQDGGFSEGQQTQSVVQYCSNVTFNVVSPHNSETINLSADGPCGSSKLSVEHLHIQFTDCTCPFGFQPLDSDTRCDCNCDSELSPHIIDCNLETESLVRVNTNSWITHINNTDPPGYIIHPNCPFDYCQPPTENVSMNLNLPNGSDAQCAYSRSGVLCGACQEHLSRSLGSSRCLPCHSHWPAVLVVILLAAIIAGILLVTALLVLNMTVAVGLINGFIFYANIVAANSSIFFPSSEPSFPTVFVAWLNLDIGIDVCFFDGLDAYTKIWLQLAFPVYIISLVVIVIIFSEYSPRFAGLIGKRDPIATLATLILLSYAKLLSVIITALSFAVLNYPDGSQRIVWLPDGNVEYFQGKHIALVLVAPLIILVGVPYTILLFLWQWIVRAPKWKVFTWTRNTKLNAFVSVHHVPYNSKYRYWTGLLLLVRVVLYITATVTVSSKPQTSLLVTIILVGGLSLIKGITGTRVYKNSLLNVIETGLYYNLLVLSVFSWYDFKSDIKKQTAVAYISTITTFILLVGVIIYHVYLLVRKDHPQGEEMNEYPLAPYPVQPVKAEVTHSIIEIPKPRDQPPPPEANMYSDKID